MNDVEICPICRKPYTKRSPKEKYHLQYQPEGEFIYACRRCNYAEYLTRHSHKYLKPWLWKRLWLVKRFAKENPHLKY